MKRYCNIILWATVTCLGLWLLPWIYNFTLVNSYTPPFMMYSPVLETFAGWKTENDKKITIDENGNILNSNDIDTIFPTYYYRQLISDGKMPDTIQGKAMTSKNLYRESFSMKYSPIEHNANTIPLYLLLESASGRVDLEMPKDAFRFTDNGLEFVDMRTNEVKANKSQLFSEMLAKKGFVHPIKKAVANQTTHKEYDNGYLLLDAEGKLFHMKQMKGRPYVKAIEMPEGLEVKDFMVTEFRNKRHLGFIFDNDDKIWLLHAESYTFHKLDIDRYDCETQYLKIFGNLLDWTISVRDPNGEWLYAISNDDYSLIRKHFIKYEEDIIDKIGKYILPIKLRFSSPLDEEIHPRLEILNN